jgi:hypothetical protein
MLLLSAGRGIGARIPLPEAFSLVGQPRNVVSVTDAPLTSPEFAEALRAFCKDVVAAQ